MLKKISIANAPWKLQWMIFAGFICKTLLIAQNWIHQKHRQAAPRFLKGTEFLNPNAGGSPTPVSSLMRHGGNSRDTTATG